MKKMRNRLLLASMCLLLGWMFQRGETSAQTAGRTLNLPILRSTPDTFTGFAFLNLGKDPVTLTAKAYGASGSDLSGAGPNPASRTLLPLQQLSLLAPELFNFVSSSSEGWAQVQASQDSIVGFELLGSGNLAVLDGINLPLASFRSVILTDVEYDSDYSTEVHVANPNTLQNNVVLELYNSSGTLAGRFSSTLAPLGKLARSIPEMFPSLPQPFLGYLIVRGEQDVAAAELLVSGSAIAALNGQRLQSGRTASTVLYSAQLGNRRSVVFTRLNLVNPTTQSGNLILRAVDDNGSNLGSSPRSLTLTPGQQSRRDVADLFALDPDRTTSGSLIIESDTTGIVGDVSFGDDSGANRFRASLPLDSEPSKVAAFAHVATAGVFITGVAAFNPNPQPASVSIRVFRPNGTVVGTTTRQIPANGRFSKLLFPELVITAVGQAGGFFTLESDQAITSFALFGATGGGSFNALAAIPPQRLITTDADNPVPVLTALTPSSATAGGQPFSLAVSGSSFVQGSVVRWNGSPRTTTFVSSTQLTAAITAADITSAGSASVTVFNPAPGGGASGARAFTVNAQSNPAPVLSGLNPSAATAGAGAFTLTVTGANFVSGSAVRWNGLARTTTFVSATQLTAAVTAADIASAGTASVTVFTPAPGGGTSGALSFTVNALSNPVPTIGSLSPSAATAGGSAFTLTVNGANFVSGSTVKWKGSDRTTTFVSTTQLTASITAADIAAVGSASITVFSPAPGGGTSSASSFTINSGLPSSTSAKADYQFQGTRNSSVTGAPALADLSPNTFVTAAVDGIPRTVLRFAAHDGLVMTPTTGVISNGIYTAVILFSFESIDGFRRILDFKNGTSDSGLYFRGGRLTFYNAVEAPGISVEVNTFVQVVLTRDSAKKVTGYVNGAKQFEFTDSSDLGLIDSNNTLRFFKDNTSGGTGSEASAGSVARIRLYDSALSAAEVAALDRLSDVASPAAGPNLLRNSGAEEGAGGSGDEILPLPGWTTTSNFTAARYGSSGNPTAAESQRISGGSNFFYGGPSNPQSSTTQIVDLSADSAGIDGGGRTAFLRAYLTGFGDGDNSNVKAEFLNASGGLLGSLLTLGPVSGPGGSFQLKETSGTVPTGTRSVRVTLTSVRAAGSYNDGYFDNIFLALNSTAGAAAPAVELDPASLNFADVTVGQSKDLTLTVRNTGNAALTVTALTSSNGLFSIVSPTVPFSVAAGSQQAVSVRFSPVAAGTQAGNLTIASNDGSRPSLTVGLSGSGSNAPVPSITVSPASLDFGDVAAGQAKDLTLTVHNIGNVPLTVSAISSTSPQFAVTTPGVPFTIAAAGQQTVTVRFTPASAGAQVGTLTLASDDPSRPSVTVALSGTRQSTGSAPAISDVTLTRLPLGFFDVTVVLNDPDSDAVRLDFQFYQASVLRSTLTEANPSGFPNGSVTFTLSLGPQSAFLDRVEVTATDSRGNPSNKFTRTF